MDKKIKVVLWDVGGVLTESPIKNFEKYEKIISLPKGSIVKINNINHLNNAWAKYEKNMISKKKFIELFKDEAKSQNILKVDPLEILSCLEVSFHSLKETLAAFTAALVSWLDPSEIIAKGSSLDGLITS